MNNQPTNAPAIDEIQTFHWSGDCESGFIIRREPVTAAATPDFKAEEWRSGDIVDVCYGSYSHCQAWTTKELAQHLAWRVTQEQQCA